MDAIPEPSEIVPGFIEERFADHSTGTLRQIAAYTRGETSVEEVPDYVVEVCSLQDDDTVGAIGTYAAAAADYLDSADAETLAEARELQAAEEQAQEADEDEATDEDEDGDEPGHYGFKSWR